jgi:hypothetical protein
VRLVLISGDDRQAVRRRTASAAMTLRARSPSPEGLPNRREKGSLCEWLAKERARGAMTVIAGMDFAAQRAGVQELVTVRAVWRE